MGACPCGMLRALRGIACARRSGSALSAPAPRAAEEAATPVGAWLRRASMRAILASILRLAECTARSTPSAAGRGAATLVCQGCLSSGRQIQVLRVVSRIIIICMNTPEGCQHGTHSFSIYRVIKLIPPVLGIPAHPEQTRETQARTPNPKRPGIVHSQCVPGAEG